MSYLTYIFPVLAVFFVLMAARQWLPALSSPRLPQDPDTGRKVKPRFSFDAPAGRLGRLDAVLCLVLTVCYAASAT